MERTDEMLMSAIASRDREAFAEFYDRHSPRVLGLLLAVARDRTLAQDALQEAFWHVWARADDFNAALGTPLTWLTMIARSRGLDLARRARVRRAQPLSESSPAMIWASESGDELCEEARRARSALEQLPEEQRSVIVLAFYRGLTREEIAELQGIPVGTVKTRVRAGVRRLRELLAPAAGARS